MKEKIHKSRLFLGRFNRFLLTTLMGGLLVVLPATLFILVLRFFFDIVTGLLEPVKDLIRFAPGLNALLLDLLALALVLAAFFLIGLLVRTRLGNQLVSLLEDRLLARLPFYTLIRDTVQQLFGNRETPFKKVVLVDIMGTGALMTGFITAESATYLTVFVPTGPNPTNGFIFHVKPEMVQRINVKPEEAMRTIIGVGTGSQAFFGGPTTTRTAEKGPPA